MPTKPSVLSQTGNAVLWTLGTIALLLVVIGPATVTTLRRRSRRQSHNALVAWDQTGVAQAAIADRV